MRNLASHSLARLLLAAILVTSSPGTAEYQMSFTWVRVYGCCCYRDLLLLTLWLGGTLEYPDVVFKCGEGFGCFVDVAHVSLSLTLLLASTVG